MTRHCCIYNEVQRIMHRVPLVYTSSFHVATGSVPVIPTRGDTAIGKVARLPGMIPSGEPAVIQLLEQDPRIVRQTDRRCRLFAPVGNLRAELGRDLNIDLDGDPQALEDSLDLEAWLANTRGEHGIAGRVASEMERVEAVSFDAIADTLEQIYADRTDEVYAYFEKLFEAYDLGEVVRRAKSFESIKAKLVDYSRMGTRIDSFEDAEVVINDGVGVKLLLDDTSPAAINKLLDALIEMASDGAIRIDAVKNYRGRGTDSYLSEKQIRNFKAALDKVEHHAPSFYSEQERVKKSGYTSLQLDLVFVLRDGTQVSCDFHIRGRDVDDVSFAEHFAYKLRKGKIDLNRISCPELLSFAEQLQTLTSEEKELYSNYQNACYEYARAKEQGGNPPVPQVPLELRHPLFDLFQLSGALHAGLAT
jgi:hypothetical protein